MLFSNMGEYVSVKFQAFLRSFIVVRLGEKLCRFDIVQIFVRVI